MIAAPSIVAEVTVDPTDDTLPFTPLPGHTELPSEDGTFVKNFQEYPQSILLTDAIWPVLQQRHPDGNFAIGQDSGIYWRLTNPRERGAISPDWYYVPNVPATLGGQMRRSYVMWQEHVAPLIVIEFLSETPGGERDKTPYAGKFWIYEQVIRPAFYILYEVQLANVEVYHLVEDAFVRVIPNQRDHYPIPQLGIEVGIWLGEYRNVTLPWLRLWDAAGNLLPTSEERAESETQRADAEAQRADLQTQRAQLAEERAIYLAEKLRSLGVDAE